MFINTVYVFYKHQYHSLVETPPPPTTAQLRQGGLRGGAPPLEVQETESTHPWEYPTRLRAISDPRKIAQ